MRPLQGFGERLPRPLRLILTALENADTLLMQVISLSDLQQTTTESILSGSIHSHDQWAWKRAAENVPKEAILIHHVWLEVFLANCRPLKRYLRVELAIKDSAPRKS